MWKKCIELNEPVAFIEQDADCIRPWGNETFDEVLILNIESAFRQKVFEHLASLGWIRGWNLGVNTYDESPIPYRHSNKSWKGSYMMPGTASYAITPKGANKLLKNVNNMSKYFFNKLNILKKQYPNIIKEVRGVGLLIGLQLFSDQTNFIKELMNNRLLTIRAAENVVRILPPLNVKKNEIDLALKIINKVCERFN